MAQRPKTGKPKPPKRKTRSTDKPTTTKPKGRKHTNGKAGDPVVRRMKHKPRHPAHT